MLLSKQTNKKTGKKNKNAVRVVFLVLTMVFDHVGACEISSGEYRGKSIHLSRTASSAHALWMLRGLAAALRTFLSFSSPPHPPSPRERRPTEPSPCSRFPLRRVGCRCFGIGWLGFCVGGVAGSPSPPGPRWRHLREEEEEDGRLASRLPQKESRSRLSLSLVLFPPRKPSPPRHAPASPDRRREASGSSGHLRLAGGDGDDDDWFISFVWNSGRRRWRSRSVPARDV